MNESTPGHRELWWPSPSIKHAEVLQLDLAEPFRTVHGAELDSVQISYESWGDLNAAGDNAVLIIHPMTADPHATGAFADQEMGWWEPLIGPGRAIDTDTHFVVCPNLIGGCYGTTGPRFAAPDGEPFLDRFPLLTPLDMMRVQRLMMEPLGIERFRTVIGPSMGGMIAWEWAIEGSDLVDQVAVIAAPLRTSPHQIGLNWLQRRGIELDMNENEVVSKFGQMVARGVGMLSYRSPSGMEEKFGRAWFKEPGSTLKDRGMFNVESWLRHHGKRSAKKFDPYTYLLYSRAMDLHDVGHDRSDLVATLGRVETTVTVVGISSDYLYPPNEVHHGFDILRHLGKPAHYAEITSLHGHDAFLLETEQLDQIFREMEMTTRASVVRERRPVRIGILGAGSVAKAFVELVEQRRSAVAADHGLLLDVRAVADRVPELAAEEPWSGLDFTSETEMFVKREDIDVFAVLTKGIDAAPLVTEMLRRRRPVVSPNKPLIRAHADELETMAFEHGVRLAYHDSIAAGWPILYALERPLAQGELHGVRAMLSSSCNRILERVEAGASLEDAISEARGAKETEPDPELDLSGWDAAQKLGILLSRASGLRYRSGQLTAVDLRTVPVELVQRAGEQGFSIKQGALAVLHPTDGWQAIVTPVAVGQDTHLGGVRGRDHVVVLETTGAGEIVHVGDGAGTVPVATAVLNDLIGIFDLSRSWTGRYPASTKSLSPVPFSRFLGIESGKVEVSTESAPHRVPLLKPRARLSRAV